MAPTHGMVVLAERQNPQHPHVENKNEKFTREKKKLKMLQLIVRMLESNRSSCVQCRNCVNWGTFKVRLGNLCALHCEKPEKRKEWKDKCSGIWIQDCTI
jgi:hypothetical protein